MPDPSLREMARVFGRIGVLSFGGPAAQIALMHRELVERSRWLSEQRFLGALSFCMMLPGPEAMQLATWCGWRLRGTLGGLLAGMLFVLPGALVIAALALAYVAWGTLPAVQAAFLGIKATVIVIVLQAMIRLSRRALTDWLGQAVAVLAFAAILILGLPLPAIIVAAAAAGALLGRAAPPEADPAPDARRGTATALVTWGLLWIAPVAALWLAGQAFLADIGLFFGKLAVVSFGGAYAVLAYMTQTVVQTKGWIDATQMIDALGLAETTPGPLILVTQFVAMLAGAAQGGVAMALAAGALSLWMTFVPCFLWIFALAPHVDRLMGTPRLASALAAVTAAVVGVIADLSIRFALQILFSDVGALGHLPWPDPASFQPLALGLAVLASGLILGLRLPLIAVLGIMAAAGLGLDALVG